MTATDSSDAALLASYLESGSEESFAELVRRHVSLVYSAALRQLGGDAHRAEDITQAVFADMARQARRLRQHPSLVGWLYTTTRHHVCHLLRGDLRRQRREQEAHAMQQLDRDDIPDWDALRPVLDDALSELQENDRLAILMRYMEGRDLRSVGEVLGVSQDAARMRIDRAIDRLRGVLHRRGFTATASALSSTLVTHAAEVIPASLAAQVTASAMAAAATATGAGVILAQVPTQLSLMKIPIIATSVTAAIVAVPLVIQQTVRARQVEIAALRQQVSGLEDLRAQNEQLRSLAAAARELEELRGGQDELRRLQEEVARLRASTASPLHAEFAAARVAQAEAEAEREKIKEEMEFEAVQTRVINDMKQIGITARVFATDNQDALPETFEQVAHLLPDGNNARAQFAEQFEFYPQPRKISEAEPGLFLVREKQPRRSPDGRWVRVYTLVDGSVQTFWSDTEDFTRIEQERGGIGSEEIPDHLRDELSSQPRNP